MKAHLHFYLVKPLSALDNGLCLCAKAFKFQNNLVTRSSMKRKRNVVMTEIKLETTDQLAIGVRVLFWQCTTIYGDVIRLSRKIDHPKYLWSQLVRIIGVLLYSRTGMGKLFSRRAALTIQEWPVLKTLLCLFTMQGLVVAEDLATTCCNVESPGFESDGV